MYNGKGQDIIFNILISKNKFFKSYKKSKKNKNLKSKMEIPKE